MKKLLMLIAIGVLSACETAPAAYTPTPLDFSGAPVRLNVAQIRVVENYHAPMARPNVEQEFPTPPAAAVKKWVAQRLTAVGSSGALEVAIDDASVREVPLPKTGGIKGVFTDDQDARYDGNLRVTLRLYDGMQAGSVASGDVSVMRSRSINEKATVNERTRFYETLTKEMMMSFDNETNARLRQYFSTYIR